jgi:hypothetical protein
LVARKESVIEDHRPARSLFVSGGRNAERGMIAPRVQDPTARHEEDVLKAKGLGPLGVTILPGPEPRPLFRPIAVSQKYLEIRSMSAKELFMKRALAFAPPGCFDTMTRRMRSSG